MLFLFRHGKTGADQGSDSFNSNGQVELKHKSSGFFRSIFNRKRKQRSPSPPREQTPRIAPPPRQLNFLFVGQHNCGQTAFLLYGYSCHNAQLLTQVVQSRALRLLSSGTSSAQPPTLAHTSRRRQSHGRHMKHILLTACTTRRASAWRCRTPLGRRISLQCSASRTSAGTPCSFASTSRTGRL